MRFVAIAIKVSGRDPRVHNILEIGAMIGDFCDRAITAEYHCILDHKTIKGEASALSKHHEIVDLLAKKDYHPELKYLDVNDVAQDFLNWLIEAGILDKITFAGSNFLNFTERFLKRIPHFVDLIDYDRQRSLDLGSMYFDPVLDDAIPGLHECLRRAGIFQIDTTRALNEAKAVRSLLYKRYPSQYRLAK